jgi:hypothetical protein
MVFITSGEVLVHDIQALEDEEHWEVVRTVDYSDAITHVITFRSRIDKSEVQVTIKQLTGIGSDALGDELCE